MNNIEIAINKIAQGIISIEQGVEWFESVTEDERIEIMRKLDLCIFQSHPTSEDIEMGIAKSGLKETFSPCVLIQKKPFNEVRQKVLKMTGLDQCRAFKLFLVVFGVADEKRRKEQCRDGCSHEWHNL